MTSIVGIRCSDGVVIGADSSATFGDGRYVRTIEQQTEKKIEIFGDQVIIAGTGYVGHAQRFSAVVRELWDQKQFQNKSGLTIAKMLASNAINDFGHTIPPSHLKEIMFSALVAYQAEGAPHLCELLGPAGFQPELKHPGDLWFASNGSGQVITDPFLALFRSIFWKDGPPNIAGGIFTAMWALQHACEVNPGGIKEPIKLAVLESHKGKFTARMLTADELKEQHDVVQAATEYFAEFKSLLTGKMEAQPVPKPD